MPGRGWIDRAFRSTSRKRGLLPLKHMRKVAWRLMIRAMPREVARFVQSRFEELKISGNQV